MTSSEIALQDRFAPEGRCFGCGPKNDKGLRIKSYVEGDRVVAEWTPELHHEAFDGILCGGIVGSLLDCHSNWTASHALMKRQGLEVPPCTVTAEYTVKMKRPTPTNGVLKLSAWLTEISERRAVVEATLAADDICATCTGVFVAVKPDHPAYHRW